jgi:hypothetical protein
MDAYAEPAAADEILIEIAGRTLPIEFRATAENPLWLGEAGDGAELFHWACRLGSETPIEFHHTQSWPEFDAATAVGCLLADAEDVQAAGSLSAWIDACGLGADADQGDAMPGRLARVYEAMQGFLPRLHDLIALPRPEGAHSFAPSFAA